jgi:hypothetical protein
MQELRNDWNIENGEGDDDEVLQRNAGVERRNQNDDNWSETERIANAYYRPEKTDEGEGEQAGDDEGNFNMEFDPETGDIPERPKRGRK